MSNMVSDPAMLLSMVNMWLRDSFPSLDELCAAKEFDKTELLEKLKSIGYEYDSSANKFV